jgi:Raf kinase inhibitor-like YbhB/YbcL family protein
LRALCVVAAGVALAGCGAGSPAGVPTLRLSSPAFAAGRSIPRLYTCDGRDLSPPLRWSTVPAGASSLDVALRDLDAPGGSFIHWMLTGIAPGTSGLAAGQVPAGASEGRNGFGTVGYRGPCPPGGDKPHRYVLTVTAVSGTRVVAAGTLLGTYGRGR